MNYHKGRQDQDRKQKGTLDVQARRAGKHTQTQQLRRATKEKRNEDKYVRQKTKDRMTVLCHKPYHLILHRLISNKKSYVLIS